MRRSKWTDGPDQPRIDLFGRARRIDDVVIAFSPTGTKEIAYTLRFALVICLFMNSFPPRREILLAPEVKDPGSYCHAPGKLKPLDRDSAPRLQSRDEDPRRPGPAFGRRAQHRMVKGELALRRELCRRAQSRGKPRCFAVAFGGVRRGGEITIQTR